MSNHLITICARGGSKSIPDKNIRPMNGKPLIAYTIEIAHKIAKELPADIALSTDSRKIRDIAANYGVNESYIRPEELAGDTVGKIPVIEDVKVHYEKKIGKTYDFVWDLDVSSPLRNRDDLMQAFKLLEGNPQALNIFSVSPANKNPYFNIVEEKTDGYVQLVKQVGEIRSRQQAPVVYDMNASFYIFRKKFFDEKWNISTTDRSLCYVVSHICFDLDFPIDFEIMEFMFRENLLDFEL